jgi:hypothetical protein
MNDSITRRDAHMLLQQALSQEMGFLIWTNDPIAFGRALYDARAEDPVLQSIKILNIDASKIAIAHEPNAFQLEDDDE